MIIRGSAIDFADSRVYVSADACIQIFGGDTCLTIKNGYFILVANLGFWRQIREAWEFYRWLRRPAFPLLTGHDDAGILEPESDLERDRR